MRVSVHPVSNDYGSFHALDLHYGELKRLGVDAQVFPDQAPDPARGRFDRYILHNKLATKAVLDQLPERSVIVHERLDCSQVWARDALEHPAVYAFWKMSRLSDEMTIDGYGRPHYTFIGDGDWPDVNRKQRPVSAEAAGKVVAAFTFGHWPKTRRLEKADVDFSAKRSVDVFFAGSIDKYHAPVQVHRRQCIKAIEAMGDRFKVRTHAQKALRAVEFDRVMLDTRIAVSPWGNGETCHRDYEAMLAGCVLVKPYAYDIQTLTDVYRSGGYVPCRPDFADLADVVARVLDGWDQWRAIREENQQLLRSYLDTRWVAGWIKDQLS